MSRPRELPHLGMAGLTLEPQLLRALWMKSTEVVAWYSNYPGEVRGPFCRWFKVTDVAPEYKKHVAEVGDDSAYAAAAMNALPHLLDHADRLSAELSAEKLKGESCTLEWGELLDSLRAEVAALRRATGLGLRGPQGRDAMNEADAIAKEREGK